MTALQISIRIDHLRTAIAYSRFVQKYMTIGEGIMCHQEIASWYSVLDQRTEEPRYIITPAIEKKVNVINQLVIKEKWRNPSELI